MSDPTTMIPMAVGYSIKQGDYGFVIETTLGDASASGLPPLTGATVHFKMSPVAESGVTEPVLDAVAEIVDADTGAVAYTWAQGDTDVVGVYDAEWEVRPAGGGRITFPSDDWNTVIIRADLSEDEEPPPGP